MTRLLLIDERRSLAETLAAVLPESRWCTTHVTNLDVTLAILEEEVVDIVVCNVPVPQAQLGEFLRAATGHCDFIVVVGAHDDEVALELIRAGAFDAIGDSRILPVLQRAQSIVLRRRQRLEEQLSAARRESILDRSGLVDLQMHRSVVTSAAALAHEINNPLTYVLANIELATTELRESGVFCNPQIIDDLQSAHDGAERIRQLVVDIATLAYAGETTLKDLVLAQVVNTVVRLVGAQIRMHDINLEVGANSGAIVTGNRGELVQVVLNLMTNAIHAVLEPTARQRHISIASTIDDGEAALTIADSGPGISDEIRRQVFEPFFTTKSRSEGTGLGLAISREIVNRHGGDITIGASPFGGALVCVSIPLASLSTKPTP